MTPKAFGRLLDRHGTDLARWPQAEAQAARRLLGESEEAQALLRAADALESALRETRPRADAETLARMQGRIASHIARSPPPRPAARGWQAWLRPLLPAGAGALLTLAASGLWLSWPATEELGMGLAAPRLLLAMDGD